LRNVPDGRRDGLGHLTVYSKDYVLEYEWKIQFTTQQVNFLIEGININVIHVAFNNEYNKQLEKDKSTKKRLNKKKIKFKETVINKSSKVSVVLYFNLTIFRI
jgi:hypothetical protein